jgi:hypothetical protein
MRPDPTHSKAIKHDRTASRTCAERDCDQQLSHALTTHSASHVATLPAALRVKAATPRLSIAPHSLELVGLS